MAAYIGSVLVGACMLHCLGSRLIASVNKKL